MNFASRENNGIREKNLLALLLPIGVDLRTVDPLLIGRLDDLGSRRGAAAHLSISRAVRTGVDPANELAEIKHIRAGLAAVDALLDSLLADARP